MKTYITLDYELFFGESGSVERSIVDPTERVLSILDKYNAKAVFFVDVGYLIRMKDLADNEPKLKEDEKKVKEQIKNLVNNAKCCIRSFFLSIILKNLCLFLLESTGL